MSNTVKLSSNCWSLRPGPPQPAGLMSWQPLAPESGFYFLNPKIFMSQQRFFIPVFSHNIFSSLFESGNNSTSLNSCLPASNVTFLFVFFQGNICQLSPCPFLLLGESSLTCGTTGVWSEVRVQGWVTNASVTHACTGFLVCSKTKGRFLWDTHEVE